MSPRKELFLSFWSVIVLASVCQKGVGSNQGKWQQIELGEDRASTFTRALVKPPFTVRCFVSPTSWRCAHLPDYARFADLRVEQRRRLTI